jgi:hypothetical protein
LIQYIVANINITAVIKWNAVKVLVAITRLVYFESFYLEGVLYIFHVLSQID